MKTHKISVTTGYRKDNEIAPLIFEFPLPETIDEASEAIRRRCRHRQVQRFAATSHSKPRPVCTWTTGSASNAEGKPDPKGKKMPMTKDGKPKVWADDEITDAHGELGAHPARAGQDQGREDRQHVQGPHRRRPSEGDGADEGDDGINRWRGDTGK